MEQSRSGELSPFIDRWLDVQARIEFSGSTPTHIIFTYQENGQLHGGMVAIDPDFNTNQVYGGVMAWSGRYETTTGALVAVQISNTGSWHSFDTLDT